MSNYFSQLISAKPKPDAAAHALGNGHGAVGHFGQSDETVSPQKTYELDVIAKSGLFDEAFYLSQYPDIAQADIPPLEHFFEYGYREGRRPNFYFDPSWYLAQNPDVLQAGFQPLTHYLSYGDIEGRRPSPIFDSAWYRKHYGLGEADNALGHYLVNRKSCRFAPIAEFDIEHYAHLYPDIVAVGVDPFEHFVSNGKTGRAGAPVWIKMLRLFASPSSFSKTPQTVSPQSYPSPTTSHPSVYIPIKLMAFFTHSFIVCQ
jgi:hypothetical protein